MADNIGSQAELYGLLSSYQQAVRTIVPYNFGAFEYHGRGIPEPFCLERPDWMIWAPGRPVISFIAPTDDEGKRFLLELKTVLGRPPVLVRKRTRKTGVKFYVTFDSDYYEQLTFDQQQQIGMR